MKSRRGCEYMEYGIPYSYGRIKIWRYCCISYVNFLPPIDGYGAQFEVTSSLRSDIISIYGMRICVLDIIADMAMGTVGFGGLLGIGICGKDKQYNKIRNYRMFSTDLHQPPFTITLSQ